MEAAADATPLQTAFPDAIRWVAHDVARGHAGLALVCGYLDACFPTDEWDVAGHRYLSAAAEGAERTFHLAPGAFSGLAGLALATRSLSRGGTRYRRLLDAIESALLPKATVSTDHLTERAHGIPFGLFDVVSGLSGIGGYLLARIEKPDAAEALESILRALVAMTLADGEVPAWFTSPDVMGSEEVARMYPGGNLNCGLAHGIPGPLALMALALNDGVEVQGQTEAVDWAVGWLVEHRVADAWGVNWPAVVPIGTDCTPATWEPSRAAWCYGTPGVARALWLAGVARGRPEWRDLAVEAMKAVYRRPVEARFIDSPTFCHGVSGLLQVTLRFAHDTGLPVFEEAAATLTGQLLDLYEPDSILGYRNLEPWGNRVDNPGLLEGAPGVLLTLLAATTDAEPTWDRLFLLS